MQVDSSNFWEDAPQALRPIYTTPEISQPVLLYEGALEITQNDTQLKGGGKVEFKWFPYSGIRFTFTSNNSSTRLETGEASLRLLEISASANVQILNTNIGSTVFVGGQIYAPITVGSEVGLTYVLFHVVNFHDLIGRPTAVLTSESGWRTIERNLLEAEGWRITLDQLETTSEQTRQLNVQGGFAITHIGKLEKFDGQAFSGREAIDFLDICSHFFSFARGFRIPIILLVGYNSNNEITWQYWASRRGIYWRGVDSWFPTTENQVLADVFPGFLKWWQDWDKTANVTLHWYLESNINAGAIEGATVLTQVALELIAWVLLVEKEKAISPEGFDKLPASDKFRLLLAKIGIPLKIPPERQSQPVPDLFQSFVPPPPPLIPALVKLASSRDWMDGPHAFTELRNGIVHPKKLQKVLNAASEARVDASNLGLWYLELVLLAIFGYQGRYENRLVRPRQSGDTDFVPWSRNQDV
jgi:hypothetical protein